MYVAIFSHLNEYVVALHLQITSFIHWLMDFIHRFCRFAQFSPSLDLISHFLHISTSQFASSRIRFAPAYQLPCQSFLSLYSPSSPSILWLGAGRSGSSSLLALPTLIAVRIKEKRKVKWTQRQDERIVFGVAMQKIEDMIYSRTNWDVPRNGGFRRSKETSAGGRFRNTVQ